MSNQRQEDWSQHLSAAEMQFAYSRNSFSDDRTVDETAGSFDSLVFDDSPLFHDNGDDVMDSIKAARHAKRKAQNREA